MLSSAFVAVLVPLAFDAPTVAPVPLLAAMKVAQVQAIAARFKPRTLADRLTDRRSDDERYRDFDNAQAARFAAALKIADAHPGTPVAADAVGWALTIPRAYYMPPGPGLFRYAAKHLADQPQAAGIVPHLRGHLRPVFHPEHKAALAFTEAVAANHPDRAVQGTAQYALARQAFYRYEVAEYKRAADVEATAKLADEELDAVIGEFGSETVPGLKKTIRDLAARDLYEVRNLRVGKPMPAVAGATLAGEKFDTAVTAGKVTLVVFWTTWCGPCMRMVPQEVALAKLYAGRPFALVGVNGDDTAAIGLAAANDKGMTWLSVWEDQSGNTPLSKAFSQQGWPTIYLADTKGVIRYKQLIGDKLDKAVAELVAEAEAAAKK